MLPAARGAAWYAVAEGGVGLVGADGALRPIAPDLIVTDIDALAPAPDGSAWVFSWLSDAVVHLDEAGVLARRRITSPSALTVDTDGTAWVGSTNRITRLDGRARVLRRFGDTFGASSDCGEFASQYVFPSGMAFGADGALWAGTLANGVLLRVGDRSAARAPLTVALRGDRRYAPPRSLVRGRGGAVWVAGGRSLVELRRGRRARVFATGSIQALALGPRGRPWFAVRGAVAELPTSGMVRTVARLPPRTVVSAMIRGPGGDIWFADGPGRRIGRIARTGAVRFLTPRLGRRTRLFDLVAGSDGAVWATDHAGAILRVRPDGRVRRFTVPRRGPPVAIVSGPDDALWFTEFGRRRVGRITTRGRITEVKVRDLPVAIAAGSDGALWTTTIGGSGENGVERVSVRGSVQRFYVRGACTAATHGLLAAADGSLLITESNGPAAVARLDLPKLRRQGLLQSQPGRGG